MLDCGVVVHEKMPQTVNAPDIETFAGLSALVFGAAGQAARTAMFALVPVIELVTVSVAVMVWFPGVAKVTGNMPTPAGSVESAGSVMVPKSVLVKCAIPA